MKKRNKIISAAIIGPSGIGKAHLRELIKFGFRKIGVVGKSFKKKRIERLKNNNKRVNFLNLKKIADIKKLQPQIISICSPTKFHYNHLLITKRFCNNLIIEKPLFWFKKKKNSNFEFAKNLFSLKNINIFVNLPMISLANQLMSKKKNFKLKKFYFCYFTKGKNIFEDIPIDLLPHALSFFFTLCPNKFKALEIKQIKKGKNFWNCEVMINKCLCKFFFKQNPKRAESKLSFKINNDMYLRKQFIENGNYMNKLLRNNHFLLDIKNPMTDYLQQIFNNLKKKKILKKNNSLTLDSIKVIERLL